ncbi:MAG: hypothetical protein WC841_03555 [Candidatus Shapirobacteria bacterium]|jgi:hypothetical protein
MATKSETAAERYRQRQQAEAAQKSMPTETVGRAMQIAEENPGADVYVRRDEDEMRAQLRAGRRGGRINTGLFSAQRVGHTVHTVEEQISMERGGRQTEVYGRGERVEISEGTVGRGTRIGGVDNNTGLETGQWHSRGRERVATTSIVRTENSGGSVDRQGGLTVQTERQNLVTLGLRLFFPKACLQSRTSVSSSGIYEPTEPITIDARKALVPEAIGTFIGNMDVIAGSIGAGVIGNAIGGVIPNCSDSVQLAGAVTAAVIGGGALAAMGHSSNLIDNGGMRLALGVGLSAIGSTVIPGIDNMVRGGNFLESAGNAALAGIVIGVTTMTVRTIEGKVKQFLPAEK